MSFTWTNGQAAALSKLEPFLNGGDDNIFILSGSAGTGKTSASEVIPTIQKKGYVLGAAPTHKAVKVLSQRMPDVDCRTAHSFLGLKPRSKNGVETLVRNSRYDPSEFYHIKTVVLDEASMIDDKLLDYIYKDIENWGRKYVFLGDRYQLPPVNSLTSPCFDIKVPDHCQQELTEIMRHAGPIITCATGIRDSIIKGVEPPLEGGVAEDGSGVFLLRRNQWEAKLADLCVQGQYREDPDFCRVIGWRNETVMRHAQTVRGILGEDLSVPFQAGDNLVANEAWVQQEEVIFNTGTEFVVKGMESADHPLYEDLKGWQVWVDNYEGPLYVLDQMNCGMAYKRRIAGLVEYAKSPGGSWKPYYDLKEYYADLRALYSITSHKSQGSTFQNVMVDVRDIYVNRNKAEADRALYVAVTRASKNVYLLI